MSETWNSLTSCLPQIQKVPKGKGRKTLGPTNSLDSTHTREGEGPPLEATSIFKKTQLGLLKGVRGRGTEGSGSCRNKGQRTAGVA